MGENSLIQVVLFYNEFYLNCDAFNFYFNAYQASYTISKNIVVKEISLNITEGIKMLTQNDLQAVAIVNLDVANVALQHLNNLGRDDHNNLRDNVPNPEYFPPLLNGFGNH